MNIVVRYNELWKNRVKWIDRLKVINEEFDETFPPTPEGCHLLRNHIYRIKKRNCISDKVENKWFEGKDWKHAWVKDDDSSIFIKNPAFRWMNVEDIRKEVFEWAENYSPKYPKIDREPTKDWHLLVIDPADVHIGKLAMTEETGEEYNIDIAFNRCIEWVEGILKKTQGFNIERILLVIGNDIIHIDTPRRTTTSWTPQDTDKQWWFMYKKWKELYIKVIELLMQYADVDVVYNPSNHDYTAWFYLSDSINSWFRNCENVTFDCWINHRKYYTYGKNLIGTTHGDWAKEQDLVYLMAHEAKEEWAKTEFRYWYLHHIHHKKAIKYQSGKDYIGCTLEYLRSPSASDWWHDRNGYTGAKKAIEWFIHHPKQWQISRISHYF